MARANAQTRMPGESRTHIPAHLSKMVGCVVLVPAMLLNSASENSLSSMTVADVLIDFRFFSATLYGRT